MDIPFDIELAWARRQMPRVQKALAGLPDLHGVPLAKSMHLDLKMILLVERKFCKLSAKLADEMQVQLSSSPG